MFVRLCAKLSTVPVGDVRAIRAPARFTDSIYVKFRLKRAGQEERNGFAR
jgi:hypothetical protein